MLNYKGKHQVNKNVVKKGGIIMTSTLEKIKRSTVTINELSQFLKRKRLELGLKLEDLCSGICSSSYLSRIENSIVEVNSSYYQALFERMNINYEELKKERSRNLYHEIIQAYFRQNTQLVEELVEHALSSKSYVETEIDLMLLFLNIITHKFDEARDLIIKLDDISENFSSTELIFYLYACALYSYSTNQNKKAYQQILILTAIQYEDTMLECAIYDLAIKVMYMVGQFNQCLKFYYYLKQIAIQPLLNISLCINGLIVKTIDSNIDYDLNLCEFNEIVKYLDLENEHNKTIHLYLLGKIYYDNGLYSDVYHLLINNILSAKISSLLVAVCFHLYDHEVINNIIKKVTSYSFTKYDKVYQDYVKYMVMMFNGESDYTLFNYLRNILFVETYFYDDFLMEQFENQYLERAIGSSKYKEGLRYLIRKKQMSKHERLK